jgi:hypothetical protein
MKKLLAICLVCVLTTAAWGSYIVDFNENGVGQYSSDDGQTWYSLTYGFETDVKFYYQLPFTLGVEGFLAIMEPGTSELSDVLAFSIENENGNNHVYVFSKADGTDLADTGFISEHPEGWTTVQMYEVDFGNGEYGVTYTPGVNDPGYVTGGVTYNFTSDVPEPATICMLGIGALSLIRRKK